MTQETPQLTLNYLKLFGPSARLYIFEYSRQIVRLSVSNPFFTVTLSLFGFLLSEFEAKVHF